MIREHAIILDVIVEEATKEYDAYCMRYESALRYAQEMVASGKEDYKKDLEATLEPFDDFLRDYVKNIIRHMKLPHQTESRRYVCR